MSRRNIIVSFLIFFLIAPAWSVMFAHAQGGEIDTFTTGNQIETITISSGQATSIGFELERNTTITTAYFFVQPTEGGDSPGSVEIHLNNDSSPEWAFNNTGYGDFGQQTVFVSGNTSETLSYDKNYLNPQDVDSPPFYLPVNAVLSSANLDVGFVPNLTGGFFQTGYIHDVAKGDLNNDSHVDFALLSRTANASATNGSGQSNNTTTAFRTVSYSNTTGITFSPWHQTCTNATRIMVADVNWDDHDDVIGYAPSDNELCLHFTNATTGAFQTQLNITHSGAILDLDIGDLTGNGQAELVSIRNGGEVHVERFNGRTNSFWREGSAIVYEDISQTTKASLSHMLFAPSTGGGVPALLIVAQADGDANEVRLTSNGMVVEPDTIEGVADGSIIGDFDADGDLDIVAPRGPQHRTIENRPNMGGWSGVDRNGFIDLLNASVFDVKQNATSHLLVPHPGSPDGNPATVTGNVSVHDFWPNNAVKSNASMALYPYTSPRDLHYGDMDGDGLIEQLVLVGEGNQNGVFISAYHTVGYDIDEDEVVDYAAEGYAGNGSNGLNPLMIVDTMGNLSDNLQDLTASPTLPYILDGYGNQMGRLNLSMDSKTYGEFRFSNLEVQYTSNFLVNVNPGVGGNLSNALNQQMTLGTGSFNVPIQFATSQNGTFNILNPSIRYIDGAPNIPLPTTPTLHLIEALPSRIVIGWQPVEDFGDDLLNFSVYRSPAGQDVDLENPYNTSDANDTADFAVQPGESWTYWVRSLHNYGVASGLSAPLTVSVPYPPPQSYIPNLTAADVPDDDGGVLNVSWSSGHASVMEHHIFLLPYDFNDVSDQTNVQPLTAGQNATSLETSIDSTGTPLIDGTPYYVAAIGVDVYGNASMNVTTFGPVYTRNDTGLPTTLDVSYTDFSQNELEGVVLLARTEGLDVEVLLHQAGTPIANASLTLEISDDADSFTVDMATNETGHSALSLDALSSLGPIEAVGAMSLVVSYAGDAGDEQQQPLLSTSTTHDAYGTVLLTITPDEPIPLQDDETFETLVMVYANDPTQSAALANLRATWVATDAAGNEVSTGTAEARGNELPVTGQGAYDGRLALQLSEDPPAFYIPGMTASYAFEAAPEDNQTGENTTDDTNQTVEPEFPDITLPATVDCGTATYEWDSNATDVGITCTVTNPNPFDVMVGFAWKVIPGTPPPVELVWNEAAGPSLTVEANGRVDLTFSLVRNAPTEGMFPGLQGEGYIVHLTCLDFGENACDAMTEDTANTEGELQWTLGEMPVQVVDDNPVQDETEGAMTPVLVGIGIVIALIAGVVGVLYMRSNMDDDFFEDDDDDDDEDYYREAMDTPATTPGSNGLDLGASKSLDELKSSGKDLHSDAPEGLAASPTLGSSADAFEFGATAEDAIPEIEGSEEEEWADEEAEADDGITVDEYGTEWWEDEDGVWWYREEGWEDWAVWEE